HAINLYGIEAQPFITQVVSFCIYTDAPAGSGLRGATEEYLGPPPNFPQVPITIEGGVPTPTSPANPDFLGQVIAFQLTNPFDSVVSLTDRNVRTNLQATTDTGFTEFYLEYAANFYKLAKDDTAGLQ